ncbi:MAG: iron ABC transporter permease [Alicyclobacillaceae bacterium]|nr:iron ABC transporter permease [Alicyclobacillaceae bacterium]
MAGKRAWLWGGVLGLSIAVSVLISLRIGPAGLETADVWRAVWGRLTGAGGVPDWEVAVVWDLRLPRVGMALLVGASLAVAGAAYQGVLRNPLADPFILGVSSGAALAAVAGMLFGGRAGLYGVWGIPLLAFAGGLAGLAAVLRLGGMAGGMRNETLLLAGVVVQSFLGAVLTVLMLASAERLPGVMMWLMGSLANRDPALAAGVLPCFLVSLALLVAWARELNVMTLGEDQAAYLGVDVGKRKWKILVAASLAASASVAVSGIIGFVGLVVPHIVRLLAGPDHRILLPLSALAGGLFLLWADNAARAAVPGQEIPIGAVTAFLGAPFFAYLLRRSGRTR